MNDVRASSHLEVDLLWYKDSKGYVLEDHGRFGEWIERRGGKLDPIYPLRNDRAFKVFSNVYTARNLVEFMNRYGFLNDCNSLGSMFIDRERRKVQGAPEPAGEPVRRHLEAAAAFREILEAKPRLSQASAAWIEDAFSDAIAEVQLIFDKHGSLRPVLKPTSLINGLIWQLINSLGAGARYRPCQQCGVIFQVGVGSGRRADAKFCSDEHKILFNSRKRSLR
jgi:hypothetical protein